MIIAIEYNGFSNANGYFADKLQVDDVKDGVRVVGIEEMLPEKRGDLLHYIVNFSNGTNKKIFNPVSVYEDRIQTGREIRHG